ncbi:hypothetical protein MYXO_00604 [Myxococcaceae bacterium]|jgi:hypothetical protein|nr:hypothetical protein MYXO_00604 [Myxococcaceae bacterium]
MADAAAFECVTEALARATGFDHLAANGTVRIALKKSGLDPKTVTASQMGIVVKQILPKELKARGVAEADAACAIVGAALGRLRDSAGPDGADAVFQRLGR